MKIIKTYIPDLLIIEPKVFEDERGYFFESYNKEEFINNNVNIDFVQDNQSKSMYGVIRGLHYQLAPHSQTKLVRALRGTILDVAVDIRKDSPTYGKSFSIELSEENKKQLLIPQGFAHGFSVLTDYAVFSYKCDNLYNPNSERGINFLDPMLNIDWKIDKTKAVVSTKDKVNPSFDDAETNFVYGQI